MANLPPCDGNCNRCKSSYAKPVELPLRHWTKPRDYPDFEQTYTITVSDSDEPLVYDFKTGTYFKSQ